MYNKVISCIPHFYFPPVCLEVRLTKHRFSNYGSATTLPQPLLSNQTPLSLQQLRFSNQNSLSLQQPQRTLASATKPQQPKFTTSGKYMYSHVLHIISKSHPLWQVHAHVISKSRPFGQVHAKSHLTFGL